jgi:hypothetical protein
VAAIAFALTPEPVAAEVELEDGGSIDVNPELIWINCCRLFTPTNCVM